jgi:hypothetical protein
LVVRFATSAAIVVLLVVAAVAATSLVEFSYLESTGTSTTTTTQTLALTSTQTVTRTSTVTTGSSTSTSSSVSSESENSSAIAQVELRVLGWEQAVENLSFYVTNSHPQSIYTSDSTLVIYGNTTTDICEPFGAGTLTGAGNIRTFFNKILWGSQDPTMPTIARFSSLNMTLKGGVVNATFNLFLNEPTTTYGMLEASVHVQQEWMNNGSGPWYIHGESWDFLTTYVASPNCG